MLAHCNIDTQFNHFVFGAERLPIICSAILGNAEEKTDENESLFMVLFLFNDLEEMVYFNFIEWHETTGEIFNATKPIPCDYFLNRFDLTKDQRADIKEIAKNWGLKFIQLLLAADLCYKSFIEKDFTQTEIIFDPTKIENPEWYYICKNALN